MHKSRNWARALSLMGMTWVILLVLAGVAVAGGLPLTQQRATGNTSNSMMAPVSSKPGGDIKPLSLSSYYAGYIYLTSHTNGGTYSCTKGDTIQVSSFATDYNYWDYYQMGTRVWDKVTNSCVDSYWSSSYVNYTQSCYADIDTSGLVPSSGRYVIQVVLWDDVYGEFEDYESFNLNVVAPDNVSVAINQVSPNPAPSGGAVFFSGAGYDSAGHGITSYQWRSNINGVLSSSASFSTSALSPGTHTIYLRAQCSNGSWSPEVSTTLVVDNPCVMGAAIDQVTPSPAVAGNSVFFSGSGTSSLGHSVTGYQWRSSIDGVLSSSASFSTSALSRGSHTIYFKARCSNGTWSPEVSTALFVSDPEVNAVIDQITPSPTVAGSVVSFLGHATDTLGHNMADYEWRSSIDGALSSNASFSTSALSIGTHTIYFRAQCSNGLWSPPTSYSLTVLPPSYATSIKVYGSSRAKARRTYKVWGTLAPSSAGGRVKITLTRKVGRRWRGAGTAYAVVSGGHFSYSFKPRYRGSWRASVSYGGQTTASAIYKAAPAALKSFKVR